MNNDEVSTLKIGIDVGVSGIGKAVFRVDSDGKPVELLNSVVTIIDGGKSPDSGQSPRSRKKIAGTARRTRRLIRRRAARIRSLAALLDELGIVDSAGIYAQEGTYEPWYVRAALYNEFEPDEIKRYADLRLAILHMARHRGWRNPWWSYEKLFEKTQDDITLGLASYSENEEQIKKVEGFDKLKKGAVEVLSQALDIPELELWEEIETIGHIGALCDRKDITLRPRTRQKTPEVTDPVVREKLMQKDTLRELLGILDMQQIPEGQRDKICREVFKAQKPSVPVENIGRDPFHSDQLRAPKSSYEFQEFRIRDTLANLRILNPYTGEYEPLDITEKEDLFEELSVWTEDEIPTWEEIAYRLEVEPSALKIPSSGTHRATKPPINVSYYVLQRFSLELSGAKKRAAENVLKAFEQADPQAQKDFFAFLGDPSVVDESAEVAALLESFDDPELNVLDDLKLMPGRAAYSRETLQKLNEAMAGGADLNAALMECFKVKSGWKPAPPSLFEHFDHPVVDRILTDVGRWLQFVVEKYGIPQSVNIEHVRDAFLGPEARVDYNLEIDARRKANERAREELKSQEGAEGRIRKSDVRRYQMMQMQNMQCLYCGTTLSGLAQVEHIVPRALGGSNKNENLVVTCERCNTSKGNLPFAVWAEKTDWISFKEVEQRLRTWQKPNRMTNREFDKYKKRVLLRLKSKKPDSEIDERSLESTAYAAVELRERIEHFLQKAYEHKIERNVKPDEDLPFRVNVFRGQLTAAARKASGIERKINLRSLALPPVEGKVTIVSGRSGKNRFDRRHHALDAATVAFLTPQFAKALHEREELRYFQQLAPERKDAHDPDRSWKTYKGKDEDAQKHFSSHLNTMDAMGDAFNKALEGDRIVVSRPLRLGANLGRGHDETVRALLKVNVCDGLSAPQIARICDVDVYMKLQPWVDEKGNLTPETAQDLLERPEGKVFFPKGRVGLFPSPSPMLPIRHGAVSLGSIHHVRVYHITPKTAKGKPSYGMLRVFGGEFARFGWKKKKVDLFWEPLPVWSEAIRCANATILKALREGRARQIGWLVRGDEVEFGADALVEKRTIKQPYGDSFQETRWVVTGFESATQLNLFPAYLAREGIPESVPAPKGVDERGWRASLDDVMQSNPAILRRSASGVPRWKDSRGDGLPISWRVFDTVEQVTGEGTEKAV